MLARFPVTNREFLRYAEAVRLDLDAPRARTWIADALADHPVVDVTWAEAAAYAVWVSRRTHEPVHLPTAEQWLTAAGGDDGRTWPWGDGFEPARCACVDSGWGGTAPVDAHPAGAAPSGVEDLAGNTWEWTATPAGPAVGGGDGWYELRGGCFLDTAYGVRIARSLAAEGSRATRTTGFRLAYGA